MAVGTEQRAQERANPGKELGCDGGSSANPQGKSSLALPHLLRGELVIQMEKRKYSYLTI